MICQRCTDPCPIMEITYELSGTSGREVAVFYCLDCFVWLCDDYNGGSEIIKHRHLGAPNE